MVITQKQYKQDGQIPFGSQDKLPDLVLKDKASAPLSTGQAE
jgi:hypothetical protein